MMRSLFTTITCVFFMLILHACSHPTVHPLSIETTLTAEGPLFEGSNTIQGDIGNFAEVLKSMNTSAGKISSATLKTVTLTVDDSSNFDRFSSITLQLVSEKTDMVKVALINPVAKGLHTIEMTVASEQADLSDLFRQDKFTAVADAILNQDVDGNIRMQARCTFLLTIKK
jgi:hypothetical protein